MLEEAYLDILPTLLELEDRLNEDIQLSDYTDAVETIYFTPMILDDQTNYEERLEFDEETKEVFLQVFMDIEHNFSEFLITSLYSIQKEVGEELISNDFVLKLKKDY